MKSDDTTGEAFHTGSEEAVEFIEDGLAVDRLDMSIGIDPSID